MKILLVKDEKCLSGIFDHDIIIPNTNFFFNKYDNIKNSPSDIVKKASLYEKQYNTCVIDAIQADRHLGRQLSYLGTGHPESKLSRKAEYIKSLNLFNRAIEYWEEVFAHEHIDLVIGIRSGLVGKCCSVVAKGFNIPQRQWLSSRYQDYFHWATDEYDNWPGLKEAYETTDIETEPVLSRLREDIFRNTDRTKNINGFLHKLYLIVKKHVGSKINRRVKMGDYGLLDDISYLYRLKKNLVFMEKMPFKKRKDYVLYPLQQEPESALSVMCPEFNNQISIVETIIKNLPCNITLLVKEHIYGLGRRPKGFYNYLKKIPNVELASVYENPVELVRDSIGIVFLNSSMGYEAAFLGKPTITLNNKSNISFLPHVKFSSLNDLRGDLKDLIKAKKSEKEGRRLLTAVLKTSCKKESCYKLLMEGIKQ